VTAKLGSYLEMWGKSLGCWQNSCPQGWETEGPTSLLAVNQGLLCAPRSPYSLCWPLPSSCLPQFTLGSFKSWDLSGFSCHHSEKAILLFYFTFSFKGLVKEIRPIWIMSLPHKGKSDISLSQPLTKGRGHARSRSRDLP
jgi:hypothetical protein